MASIDEIAMVASLESKPDNIDWERRRWELASALFIHWSDISKFHGMTSVDIANKFIEEYKQSLNTEE